MKTKDEIKAKIQKWQDRLDNFQEELEVGKWYIDEGYLCNYTSEEVQYGFLNDGTWYKECFWLSESNREGEDWVLATDKEVGTALIKEAKKKGFKEGVEFKKPSTYITPRQLRVSSNNEFYWSGRILQLDGYCIFIDGEWAEIIEETPEYTMEELTEKLGYTFKIKK